MKLYLTRAKEWAGTQDDARKLAGRDFVAVEVPTDKAGLLAFLNALQSSLLQPVQSQAPVASAAPSWGNKPVSLALQHSIAVEEEIAQGDLKTTIRLHNHILHRLAEIIPKC